MKNRIFKHIITVVVVCCCYTATAFAQVSQDDTMLVRLAFDEVIRMYGISPLLYIDTVN